MIDIDIKRARTLYPIHQWEHELRDWQERCLEAYIARSKPKSWLIEACPGSGKTTMGVRLLHELLWSQEADFAVIVVPNINIQDQFSRTCYASDLNLKKSLTREDDCPFHATDGHGVITNYQTVLKRAEEIAGRLSGRKFVVLMDEIHHMGQGRAWAIAAQTAFADAVKIILMTGTLFRSDSRPIPWVKYDETNACIPDFRFTYREALDWRFCRPVLFDLCNGDMSWKNPDGKEVVAPLDDDDFDDKIDYRIDAALDPKGKMCRFMVGRAFERLTAIRERDPKAGLLVVCDDKEHAKRVKKLVKDETGVSAKWAISRDKDCPKPHEAIRSFRESYDPILVAVNMLSEGVDIPRLRVVCCLTRRMQKLILHQIWGRVMRAVNGDASEAWVVGPNIRPFNYHASTVTSDVRHAANLDELFQNAEKERKQLSGRGRRAKPDFSSAPTDYVVALQGKYYPPALVNYGLRVVHNSGITDVLTGQKFMEFLDALIRENGIAETIDE